MSAVSRRSFIATGSTVASAAVLSAPTATALATSSQNGKSPFQFSLNTATIREQKVGIVREIEIAQEAGYDAIEPWMDALHRYVEEGGSATDLKKRLSDAGLAVPSAIGFANWIVDDEQERKKGLENAKRDMDLLAKIGATRIAAPPVGAHDKPGPELPVVAERYRKLLEVGDQIGIVPQCELWGFSKTLSRLSETAYVAVATDHPKACILADVYHLHKGNSGFDGLKVLGSSGLQVFHMNDYPAQPGREQINDAHRVFPGDGVAPLAAILRGLYSIGFRGVLSLELFNREYWKQDPLQVAKTGLQKMRSVVQAALATP